MSNDSGKSLKFRMKRIGISMTKLSDETGIPYGSINMFFNGRQGMPEDKIEILTEFIEKMESLLEDSRKIETKDSKIKRLAYQVSVAMHEIIRIIEEDIVTKEMPMEHMPETDTDTEIFQ